jgi:hypothetical protein
MDGGKRYKGVGAVDSAPLEEERTRLTAPWNTDGSTYDILTTTVFSKKARWTAIG